jgi:hypothetical protein
MHFEKNALAYYNAGAVAVNSDVVVNANSMPFFNHSSSTVSRNWLAASTLTRTLHSGLFVLNSTEVNVMKKIVLAILTSFR